MRLRREQPADPTAELEATRRRLAAVEDALASAVFDREDFRDKLVDAGLEQLKRDAEIRHLNAVLAADRTREDDRDDELFAAAFTAGRAAERTAQIRREFEAAVAEGREDPDDWEAFAQRFDPVPDMEDLTHE